MDKVVIFTEDRKLLERLSSIVKKSLPENSKGAAAFSDPVDTLNCAMESRDRLNCFIDVDSSSCDGLKLIKLLKKLNTSASIVFMSKSGRYAMEAFELDIVDYLKLPPEEEKITEAVKKLEAVNSRDESNGVYIKTFGAFEIIKGGVRIPWKNSKPKELLAFLVDSRGDDVSSEKIQRTLWEDSDRDKAASTYPTTLYQLRKKLGNNGIEDILVGSRGSQRVDTSRFKCDMYEFEREAAEGTKEAYRRAFELYKGGYLENNSYKWSRLTRVRLQMQFEQVLQEI